MIVSAAGTSPRSSYPSSRDVTHPHFKHLFRGLMSLRRPSHGPADVISHVWRCHCGPERTLSESVHCLLPVEGRFTPVPATKSRLWPLRHGTQTPVHPHYCVDALRFGGPHRGAHMCGVLCPPCPDHRPLPPWVSGVPANPRFQPSRRRAKVQLPARAFATPTQPQPPTKCNFQLGELQPVSGTHPQVKEFTVSAL